MFRELKPVLVGMSLAMLGAFALACSLPHSNLGGDLAHPKGTGNYWIGPAISGSWYDPARDGEGFVVELLPHGRVLATWFTYPATGEAGEQAWLSAQDGIVSGDTVRFATVLRPRGTSFGADFDPAEIVLENWGTLEMRFTDCNTAVLTYAGPASYGSGTRTLKRLTSIDELECSGARQLTPAGARALSGMRAKSGGWFVPSRSGEGWFIEDLPNGDALVYWFTYSPDGHQAWTVGVGSRNGTRLEFAQTVITRGTRFGDAFNASAVERVPWGRLDFDFGNCNQAGVAYASTLPGYGSATRESVRLTSLASAVCIDGTPVAKTNGNWVAGPSTPPPGQSEHAASVLDGRIYIVGGFGDPQGFKRFDTATATWSELPNLPGGRDHLASFALDGFVYASGGAIQPGGDTTTTGFRFDFVSQQWNAVPSLPANFGSHAAVLHGHGYVGNENGTLVEFDPITRMTREIVPPDNGILRDHSQVVAFLGEIWMIAGRFPETSSIAIYDPASGSWRSGPFIARPRGGFAAAVVGDQIVIAGGEVLSTPPFRVEPSVEVFTTGGNEWRFAPNLPVPVHGVTGSAVGNRFYVIGGSTRAGAATGQNGLVFSIELGP